MSIALAYLILLTPFVLAAALIAAAHRSGRLRLHLDQFRWAAPMAGLFEDRDSERVRHDVDAIRTRFEEHPSWPVSSASGERR
ncbi:hypothetical protein [Mycobacterium sp. NAZ190054]|uniref:hypothetical protein n=1 Tax=Mycobacterium sp. NAZ190054 TaxID=1747766 RepID=UPI00079B9EA7|nr:hypothetical protein [Mycobacterium sp. NAZ190054]KWX67994.1 hypothetical protein ASJ79_19560 [Mycobacterium sp. NAZ190054]